MKTGTVKFFDANKGYGFIEVRDALPTGEDAIYVHASGVLSKAIGLEAGDQVTFDVAETARGPRAVNVVALRRGAGIVHPMIGSGPQSTVHSPETTVHSLGRCPERATRYPQHD